MYAQGRGGSVIYKVAARSRLAQDASLLESALRHRAQQHDADQAALKKLMARRMKDASSMTAGLDVAAAAIVDSGRSAAWSKEVRTEQAKKSW